MKIAYIGQKGMPTKTGGVERYVEEIATRMASLGHDITVYARNNYTDKNLKVYNGVNIVNLPSIPTKNLDAISHTFFATVHALFQDYDVIHYNSIGPTSLSFIPKILKRNTLVTSTFQCQDYFHKKWGAFARAYLRFSERITCTIPDTTITVSNGLLEYARDKYKRDLVRIPNGTNIDSSENSDYIARLGLEKNEYIISISRLVRHKGVHYLIEAFNNLHKKNLHKGKKLVITGDSAYTDDYAKLLKKLAENNKDIIFTGTASGENLKQLFSHCFLFVQPSEAEGMSLALLEAMGYGRAVLVSDIPENVEAIRSAGFTFENKNVQDLENKLLDLINNPEKVDAGSRKSLQTAIDFYSWDSIVAQIESLYKKTLNEKRVKANSPTQPSSSHL